MLQTPSPTRQDFGSQPTKMRETDHYQQEHITPFVEKWDELIDWEKRSQGEGRILIDRLKERGVEKVLDVATGTGFHSVRLLKHGFNLINVDGSAEMLAKTCKVQIAYAIGVAGPVSIMVNTYGTGTIPESRIRDIVREVFDLKPASIIHKLDLLRPIYAKSSAYGHFGRDEPEFSWERTDKAEQIRNLAG